MGTPVSDIEKLLCVAESGRDSDWLTNYQHDSDAQWQQIGLGFSTDHVSTRQQNALTINKFQP